MIIQSKNFRLKLDEILKEDYPASSLNETELNVIGLVKKWVSGEKSFDFTTSGSTGIPKTITISRDKIELSATNTIKFLDPSGNAIHSSLLCINPTFIGGAMVVFRALIYDFDLYIIEPGSHIIEQLPTDDTFDLVSMVPLQYYHLAPLEKERFKIILIGGAPVFEMDSASKARIYSTYGMTETISHVALKRLDQDCFELTGDTIVGLGSEGTLEFKGSITDNKWLATNDLGEVISEQLFQWIGRKDFIINSGGIKLNPEVIEAKLRSHIDGSYLIISLPDELLGEKVVLLLEQKEHPPIDFSILDKYERPKKIIYGASIIRTASEKIDRNRTKEVILKAP